MARNTLDLGLIVRGKKARRLAWRNGEYIFMQRGDALDVECLSDSSPAYLVINDQDNKRLADGSFGVFVPAQEDLLAQDWSYMDEAPMAADYADEGRLRGRIPAAVQR